ncbi:threonine/serine exporter family protein [uncultured Rikenella sp.]|uniref:threonine/serine exporter family protein n=1 Tax=uncultured Rikenella sp. TaxID=368003 RepID=UPI0025D61CED|nr:threonine/serine exporter family protein [uncultured Rikenella sp.]
MELALMGAVLEDGVFAAIAAVGFSSISHTPRRAYFTCAWTAAVGHAGRYVLAAPELVGMNLILASFVAAFVIGLLDVLFARGVRCPAEVCLYPALLPMIPGMYAYRTVEAMLACLAHVKEELFGHYLYLLSYNGLTCTFIMLGIVVGANIPIFMLKKVAFRATR